MKIFVHTISSTALIVPLMVIAALLWGGPGTPAPMQSINDPFESVDFSTLPPLKNYKGADGSTLYFREYVPAAAEPNGSAVLIHGSSASSNSLHPMATALSAAGVHVYALDVRGHGASGHKGHIDFIGQLESDLHMFVQAIKPPSPSTLIGFSSGGGFVLRMAASEMQSSFDSYLLLSPFFTHRAPNYRPDSGGWVSVGVPRIVALTVLNAMGLSHWNDWPVTRFALSEEAKSFLTPEYGFNLAMNFAPHQDYKLDLENAKGKVAILAGDADEAFQTQELQRIVQSAGKDWPVQLLPGIQHIPLTLEPAALKAIAELVQKLQAI